MGSARRQIPVAHETAISHLIHADRGRRQQELGSAPRQQVGQLEPSPAVASVEVGLKQNAGRQLREQVVQFVIDQDGAPVPLVARGADVMGAKCLICPIRLILIEVGYLRPMAGERENEVAEAAALGLLDHVLEGRVISGPWWPARRSAP